MSTDHGGQTHPAQHVVDRQSRGVDAGQTTFSDGRLWVRLNADYVVASDPEAKQIVADLRMVADLCRSYRSPSRIALADRLDALADTLPLDAAVIKAAEAWRATYPSAPYPRTDPTRNRLLTAIDARRVGRSGT